MAIVATSEPLTLPSGPTISMATVRLAWRLESRGICLEREGERLAVGPGALLTDVDRHQIRELRDELLLLLDATGREM